MFCGILLCGTPDWEQPRPLPQSSEWRNIFLNFVFFQANFSTFYKKDFTGLISFRTACAYINTKWLVSTWNFEVSQRLKDGNLHISLTQKSLFQILSHCESHRSEAPFASSTSQRSSWWPIQQTADAGRKTWAAKLSPFRKSERWNSKLWEFILLTLSLILDHSSLILDPWSFIFDPLSLIFDPWSLIHDPWSMILDPWSLIHDPWFMILDPNM